MDLSVCMLLKTFFAYISCTNANILLFGNLVEIEFSSSVCSWLMVRSCAGEFQKWGIYIFVPLLLTKNVCVLWFNHLS